MWCISHTGFQLETPDGTRINPVSGGAGANAQYVRTNRVGYYRCALPVLSATPNGSHVGRWHAVLKLGRTHAGAYAYDRQILSSTQKIMLKYELVAHTYSSLTFGANLVQSSFEPGAIAEVSATLLEFAAQPIGRAVVWAEVQKPGASGVDVVSLAPSAGDLYHVS